MTTAADMATAIAALKTVAADILPQATNSSNAASAQKLQSALNTLNATVIPVCNDVAVLVVGF